MDAKRSESAQLIDDEMTVWLMNGQNVQVSLRDIGAAAIHPQAIFSYLSLILLFRIISAYPILDSLPLWKQTAIYMPSIAAGVLFWVVGIVLVCLSHRWVKAVPVISAVASLSASSAATVSAYILSYHYGLIIPANISHVVPVVFVNFVAAEFLTMYILRAILPSVKAGQAKVAIKDQPEDIIAFPTQHECIVVGDHSLSVNEILLARSHGNYLEIICKSRKLFITFRMKALVEMMPAAEGMRVHRSFWVAFQHIDVLETQGRSLIIILKDGTEVPVSRDRTTQVSQNYKAWLAGRANINTEDVAMR